jgi:hypothetical protein
MRVSAAPRSKDADVRGVDERRLPAKKEDVRANPNEAARLAQAFSPLHAQVHFSEKAIHVVNAAEAFGAGRGLRLPRFFLGGPWSTNSVRLSGTGARFQGQPRDSFINVSSIMYEEESGK